MLTEDSDLALRLLDQGYRVEMSFSPVETLVPRTPRGFFKQKMRWAGGMSQDFLSHYHVFLSHPVFWLFTTLFLGFVVALVSANWMVGAEIRIFSSQFYNFLLNSPGLSALFGLVLYPLTSLPYAVHASVTSGFTLRKMLAVYPFGIFYAPFIVAVYLIGWLYGAKTFFTISPDEVVWSAEQAGRAS
jgi:cellulose synthase/poly-beta-1,6-N-acetylglucosamine synthase-like glycosyltransferase